MSEALDYRVKTYEPEYIFCGKVKFLKNPKSREKLVKAVQLRADQILRECALSKQDNKILAITSREHIRNVIIPSKIIVPVTSRTEGLASCVSKEGHTLSVSTKKNVRRRLETQFRGLLDIMSISSGKLLLVPTNILVSDVVIENDNLKKELKLAEDANKIVDQASSQIGKLSNQT